MTEPEYARRDLERWRRLLLPFAIVIVFAAATVFFTMSVVQFNTVRAAIMAPECTHQPCRDRIGTALDAYHGGDAINLLIAEREQRANLGRANASLLLSLWTRNMGFVTGMILALVGAMFILARLDDAGTALSAGQGSLSASLKSSSPGIVLAVLGTALMLMAMSVRYTDAGKSLSEAGVARSGMGAAKVTRPLPEGIGDDAVSPETQSDLADSAAGASGTSAPK